MARNKVKDPNHLSFGRLMAWKSSDISAGWVNVIMLNYLSMYASDFLGLNIGLVGVMLFVSKLIDGLVDFFIGWLVDNTKTPWGKARPYYRKMTTCSASPAVTRWFPLASPSDSRRFCARTGCRRI